MTIADVENNILRRFMLIMVLLTGALIYLTVGFVLMVYECLLAAKVFIKDTWRDASDLVNEVRQAW